MENKDLYHYLNEEKNENESGIIPDNKIIVIIGPSASGKDTIARIISKDKNYKQILSITSRPIRKNETQNVDYNFVSKEHFIDLINKGSLIEYREYHTLLNNVPDIWYYGIEKKQVNDYDKYVAVLDIVGFRQFKEFFGNRILSIYLKADDEIRKQRCIKRGDFDEIEWNRRLKDDKEKMESVDQSEFNYVVDAGKELYEVIQDIYGLIE